MPPNLLNALLIVASPDNPRPYEEAVIESLHAMGFDVELRAEADAVDTAASDKDLVLISPSVKDQGRIGRMFRRVAVPLVCFTRDAYIATGIATAQSSGVATIESCEIGQTESRVLRPRFDQLIGGKSAELKLSVGAPVEVSWVSGSFSDDLPTGAVPVSGRVGLPRQQFVLGGSIAGTRMADDVSASFPANRVAFPLTVSMNAQCLTDNNLGIAFIEAIKWAVGRADTNTYKVLFVVSRLTSLTPCETAIDRVFPTLQRYEVEKISEKNANSLCVRGKSLVLLSPSLANQKRMGETFRSVAVPVICFMHDAYVAMGMTDQACCGSITLNQIDIAQGENRRFSHPLMADLFGLVDIAGDTPVEVSWARNLPDRSEGIGAIPSPPIQPEARRFVLFGCRAAAKMANSDESFPSRRAGFPLPQGAAATCMENADLGRLFAATVKWSVGEINTRQFHEVFREEWQEIYKRRLVHAADSNAATIGIDGKHAPKNLVGLALSGGGIRSATFGLGVLQALEELKLLSFFDYLSTVSGGGYVGAWWSAYLSRRHLGKDGPIFPPREGIEPQRLDRYLNRNKSVAEGSLSAGRDPIHHLRLFANYLTPRKGILSGDTWRAIAVVTRNLILTWVMLLPILFAAVVAAQSVFMLRTNAQYNFFHDYRGDVERVMSSRNERVRGKSDAEIKKIDEETEAKLAPLRDDYTARLVDRGIFIVIWLSGFVALIIVMLMAFMRSNAAIPYLVKALDWLRGGKNPVRSDQAAAAHLLGSIFVGVSLLLLGVLGVQASDTLKAALMMMTSDVGYIALVVWFLIAGVVILYSMPWRRLKSADPKSEEELRRGVWRNRITKIHSILLVTVVCLAAILGFAGFGHELFDYIFRDPAPKDLLLGYVTKTGGWLVLIGSTVGALFTAFKSAPTAGHDRGDIKEPPAWQNAVFAVTPPLVMITLMVLFAWLSHQSARFLALREEYPWPLIALIVAGIVLASIFALLELWFYRWSYWIVLVPLAVVIVEAFFLYLAFSANRLSAVALARFSLIVGVLIVLRFLFVGTRWVAGLRRFDVLGLTNAPVAKDLNEKLKLTNKRKWRSAGFFGGALLCVIVGWILIGYFVTSIGSRPALSLSAMLGVAMCPVILMMEALLTIGDNNRSRILTVAVFIVSVLLLIISFHRDLPYSQTRFALVSLGLLVGSLTWVLSIGWMADPNAISMHGFYRSRLIRAYLGASNAHRQEGGYEITETATGDDVLLKDLRNCERGAPYHLLNTTLNLTAGRDLATAQRSSAMFVLSRLYCGSFRTGFQRSSGYANGSLTLGMACATSGAAVSPGMGSGKTTSSQAMLMTILNIRLGFWAPTPSGPAWREGQARLWPFYSLREFLSQTNDLSSYCYLTDGGHFDNTGLYSLVERGCRYIVAIDAAADPAPCFSDLGNAIRRCRIDFNVEINLDISAFQPSKDNGFAKQHFVVGEIVYSKEHVKTLGWLDTSLAARTGVIIYVKSALLQDEKDLGPDVRQYGIENSDFPQQSTVDQWFDEAQFESYRQLGRHSILAAFERASLKAEPSNTPLIPSNQAFLAVQYQLDGISSAQTAQSGMRRTTAPTISPDAATTLFELVKQASV